MKKILLIALLFCLQSCVAQNVFEDADYQAPTEPVLICTVDAIQNNTAWIYTRDFKVKYEVDAKGLKLHNEYIFSLYVEPGQNTRGGKAKIKWFAITPEQAKADIRQLMSSSNKI